MTRSVTLSGVSLFLVPVRPRTVVVRVPDDLLSTVEVFYLRIVDKRVHDVPSLLSCFESGLFFCFDPPEGLPDCSSLENGLMTPKRFVSLIGHVSVPSDSLIQEKFLIG